MTLPEASLDQRVDAGLAEYLRRVDAGERLTVEAFLQQCPADIVPLLRPILETAEIIEHMAGPEDPESRGPSNNQLAGPTQPHVNEHGPDSTAPFSTRSEGWTFEDLQERQIFGDYEILELIGRGGMGMVYKARQISLNRVVAVKMILGGRFASAEDIARFYAEAHAASRVDHPNIVTIYQVGEVEGRHFFSMDYIEGTDLAQVTAGGSIDSRRAANYLKVVAQAVHAAHEQGILHRDLKPANILIDKEDRPYVSDFGLAKHVEVDRGFTNTGTAMGTPSYMPPEQAAGQWHRVTAASDVYSLGGILYAMITGQPPFRAKSSVDTLLDVLHRDPQPPRALNKRLDRDLETICMKCLRKDPAERYPTAKALADDLDRFLRGTPILARRRSRVERALHWTMHIPIVAALTGRHVPVPTRGQQRAQAALILSCIALVVLSVLWFRLSGLLAQRMPARVRVAAGRPGGMYFDFTKSLLNEFRQTAQRPIELVETSGSMENCQQLCDGLVHLGWLQAGAVNDDRVSVVAPGYYEYVHVVVRSKSDIESFQQLDGRRVCLGEMASGSRLTAETLLRFYNMQVEGSDLDLRHFETDPTTDAAVVTIGLDSSDMRRLLQSGEFRLVALPDAGSIPDRTLEAARIPQSAYPQAISEPEGIATLRTPAFLVAHRSAPDRLVRSALDALYRVGHPQLIPRATAATWTFLPWHPAARAYYAE